MAARLARRAEAADARPVLPPRPTPPAQVILLTDDADNRRKAGEVGVEALGTAAYARMRAAEGQAELQDLVAAAVEARKDGEGVEGGAGGSGGGKGARAPKRQRVYEEHRPMSEVVAGIKAGRYHQGTLRCGTAAAAKAAGWRVGAAEQPARAGLALRCARGAPARPPPCPAVSHSAPALPHPPHHTHTRTRTEPRAGSTGSTRGRGGWAASRWGRTSSSEAAWT